MATTVRSRMQLLLTTSRPLAWIITPNFFLAGLVHSSSTAALEKPSCVLVAGALAFPLCLVTFAVNDAFDIESDEHNPRKKSYWIHGLALIPSNGPFLLAAAKAASVVVVLLFLPASISAPWVMGYCVLLLCMVWAYSVPPLRLKERPILDSISNGFICWLVWAIGYTFSGRKALLFDPEPSAANGRLIFLLALALHGLAAAVDAEADGAAGYQTIGVFLGETFTVMFSLSCFITGMLLTTRWSLICVGFCAGSLTSVVILLAPRMRSVLIWLIFFGSFLGGIAWSLGTIVKIDLHYELDTMW